MPSFAETSRPHRQFKDDMKKQNKPQGRKQTVPKQNAKKMNWKSPLIWPHLDTAARRVGWPWQAAAICREAKQINPEIFRTLTGQVISRYIDRESCDKGVFRWKESELGKVATGHAPGGQTTRVGILVSSTLLRDEIERGPK